MDKILEFISTFRDLLFNTIMVFSLGFIYSATNLGFNISTKIGKILVGLFIGFITFIIMLFPWTLGQGLVFDTRTIVMAVTGLFFGPLTTFVSMIIPTIYRIFVGGSGVYSGVANILFAAMMGLLWNKYRKYLPKMSHYLEYYIFGILVNIMSLLVFIFFIEFPSGLQIATQMWMPYLLVFPFAIMLLAKVIENQKQRIISNETIQRQQILIQASIDATKKMEIFALDKDLNYIAYNKFHEYNMKKFNNTQIEMHKPFLDYIKNQEARIRISKSLNRAINSEAFDVEVLVEDHEEKYLSEKYAPIFNEMNDIIGVTAFIQDITDRKKYEASILYLSYRDSLTTLYNRRYFMEELPKLDHPDYLPLSVIVADINGLKIMNDAFGHQSGDLLLKKASNHFIDVFRDEKKIIRMGGDEFTILLPNTSNEEANYLLEKVKSQIEHDTVQGMHISVSFGVATKVKDENMNDIISNAENNMYAQKLFEVSSHRNKTIKTILSTLHEKNPREEQHSKRVSLICQKIGMELKMPKEQLRLLEAISELHDIGKIAIDDAIINKPGKLSESEWEMIKKHPEIGYRILSTSPEYSEIAQDILSHHERYDGLGYPRGLKGTEIPVRARIISLADAYDAMTSPRPYRAPLSKAEAVNEIKKYLGKQFDPELGALFIKLLESEDFNITQ